MELKDQLHNMVLADELDEAIILAEQELSKLHKTNFHGMIGTSFIPAKDELISFVDDFYTLLKLEIEVKALYIEMNEFATYTEEWSLEIFAFKECGKLLDPEWLADVDGFQSEILIIGNFQILQKAFQDFLDKKKWKKESMRRTREICEYLIILRLQQVFREIKTIAKDLEYSWANIPIFVAAYGYPLIYQTS